MNGSRSASTASASAGRQTRERRRWRGIRYGALYFVLLAISCAMLIPIIWTLSTSLKPEGSVLTMPPRWIPENPTLDNYVRVMGSDMPVYLLNSFIVSVGTIAFTLFVGVHAAYALSRFRFWGRRVVMSLLLVAMMMPGVANLVPLFITAQSVGLLDTYLVLILVYSVWQVPMTVWVMTVYFKNVPTSLDRAVLVDGYSRWHALYKVALPLSGPGLAAAAIVIFHYTWNEFIIALTLTSSGAMRTVPVGLHYYVTVLGVQWGELTAAVIVSLLPAVVVFVLFQRAFVRGLTAGAVKG